jgi:aspartate dehydrogenase
VKPIAEAKEVHVRAPKLRVGLIGDGAVAQSAREALPRIPDLEVTITTVLRRANPTGRAGIVTNLDELLASRPNVVVECASHEAVGLYGPKILRRGIALVVVSAGALADEGLFQKLRAAALDGIDALAAARLGRLIRVRYIGRKAPAAWRGTPAEQEVDLSTLTRPTAFYRGMARDAARLYPRNTNIAATIALAGLGFDATEVELVADPGIGKNIHQLMFEGSDGRLELQLEAEVSPNSPRTSSLTGRSIARSLALLAGPILI